jgi:small subunit ribosomal protein S2
MLATGMHLGHNSQHRNRRMLPFIFGTRAGIDIINLELSISYLRRACAVTRQVALNGGIIVFVGYRDDNLMVPPMVTKVAYQCGAYHVARRWTPGTITNARCTLQASISAELAAGQSSSSPQHANSSMAFRPDLLLLLSSRRSHVAAKEASQMSIPTVGVVDTDGDPDCVTYPIPGNDDSLAASTLVAGILAQAVQDGKQHRERLMKRRELSRQSLMEQQLKDTATQSDTTTRLLSATSLDDLELADEKE